MSNVDLHGSRSKQPSLYHSDGLLPPCQPFAAVCPPKLQRFMRRSAHAVPSTSQAPRSRCFSSITPLPPPNRAVDSVGFPLWIRRSSNIIDFRFSYPHKPPSAPPISRLPRMLAHSSNGGCRFCYGGPNAVSLTRLTTSITGPVRLQSQVLRPVSLASPSPCTALAL